MYIRVKFIRNVGTKQYTITFPFYCHIFPLSWGCVAIYTWVRMRTACSLHPQSHCKLTCCRERPQTITMVMGEEGGGGEGEGGTLLGLPELDTDVDVS